MVEETGGAVHFFRRLCGKVGGKMGQAPQFSVEVRRHGEKEIVAVKGEIDIATAPELEEALSTVGSTIVVDLSEASFIDSTGIAVLLKRRAAKDDEIRIVAQGKLIPKLFRLTALDQVFTIYPDLEAALTDA